MIDEPTVNFLPAVRAFCHERIKQITGAADTTSDQANIIELKVAVGKCEELNSVITLCKGLESQADLLKSAFKPVVAK